MQQNYSSIIHYLKYPLLIIRILLSYAKYFLFSYSVLFAIFITIFLILNINPDMSWDFLRSFSFLNPDLADGSANFNTADFNKMISYLSLILFASISLIKFLLKKFKNYEFKITNLKLFLIFGGIITAAYITSGILVISSNLDNMLFVVLGIFFIVNIICVGGFFLVNKVIDLISKAIIKI